MTDTTILQRLRDRRDAMFADLERLVTTESPSTDHPALHRCADVIAEVGQAVIGAHPERTEAGGTPVLRFGREDAPVLLLAHLDTVHPLGTLERVPYAVADGRVYGPGVLDMKIGLVQALHALAETGAVRDDRAALLVTADEELGSPHSRAVIERAASAARAVLVLEPSAGGKLKISRKGVSRYELELAGRAAHAGLNPGQGANACLGLAHAALLATDLADDQAGTTVTPTLAAAGTSANTVPDSASLALDVRAVTADEQQRVDQALRALTEPLAGVRLTVHGGINRPPMQSATGEQLFERARQAATSLGLDELEAQHVGGGSDGNFTAALGVPTLDGLGAVGAGAHTEKEWADVGAVPDRAALLAGLLDTLATDGTAEKGTGS